MGDGLVLKGKIVFEFLEDPEGSWFSKVTPIALPGSDIRETYKVALITAVLQDTCSKKLDVIDKMIRSRQELDEMRDEQQKSLADIDKLQTKFDFEDK